MEKFKFEQLALWCGFRNILWSDRKIFWTKLFRRGDLINVILCCSRCIQWHFDILGMDNPQPLGVVCSVHTGVCILAWSEVACSGKVACGCTGSCSCCWDEPYVYFNELGLDCPAVLCSFVPQHPLWTCLPVAQRSHTWCSCCPVSFSVCLPHFP